MAKPTASQRVLPTVNASSMADIAFLLLIFFLVSTEITQDQRLLVKLPPYDSDAPVVPLPPRNVLRILVNANDELLVRGQPEALATLRETTKAFILNPDRNPEYASKPTRAVLSLQNDRSTSYDVYLNVYNELQAAYNELWEAAAQDHFGLAYEALSLEQKRTIRTAIPMILSEAEPVDFLSSI